MDQHLKSGGANPKALEDLQEMCYRFGVTDNRLESFKEVFDMLNVNGGNTIDQEEMQLGLLIIRDDLRESGGDALELLQEMTNVDLITFIETICTHSQVSMRYSRQRERTIIRRLQSLSSSLQPMSTPNGRGIPGILSDISMQLSTPKTNVNYTDMMAQLDREESPINMSNEPLNFSLKIEPNIEANIVLDADEYKEMDREEERERENMNNSDIEIAEQENNVLMSMLNITLHEEEVQEEMREQQILNKHLDELICDV
eukprot:CAMPEP_0182439882 /NCGR_PEP_ID=MMETSP1167-20130531/86710_1 /TAXON_ID=2988 /ORGANISM="Mallomonas Sp, Strain CCMP3275" /LENGTH=257 /DNA_ID=CAMNT_0024633683 /DNA_START=1868 /DNA_END=2641 /DNA_ORIENTATION=-